MFYVYISLSFAIENGKNQNNQREFESAAETTYAHTMTSWYRVFFPQNLLLLLSSIFRVSLSHAMLVFGANFCAENCILSFAIYLCDISDFFLLISLFCLPLKTIKQRHIFYHTYRNCSQVCHK